MEFKPSSRVYHQAMNLDEFTVLGSLGLDLLKKCCVSAEDEAE